MSNKSEVNEIFCEFWNKKHPELRAITEYRPFLHLYEESKSPLTFINWKKLNNFNDYRLDFCLQDYTLGVEYDGAGFGHADPKQINRDRKKFNDLVLQGWVLLRFPAQTVKSSPEYVSDIIYKCFERWFK